MTSYKMRQKYCAILFSMFCIFACGTSCVYVDEELGSSFIPMDQRYDTYIDEFAIEGIAMHPVEKLSGYNSSRVTVGAIMTATGETSQRSSAFTLIPAAKYDFGKGGTVARFHFAMAKDTLSYIDESQKRILQDVNVYALDESLDNGDGYISTGIDPAGLESIANGAIYDGGDSLSFDFNTEWAQKLLEEDLQGLEESAYDSVGAFANVFPGIYIDMDIPTSAGGRINMFTLTTGADLQQYYLSGGYATMTVHGIEYEGRDEPVDTTFMFLYGAQDFSITQAATDYYSGETLTPQYALNMSSSSLDSQATDNPTDEIIVDGGGGLKPVIYAKDLRESFMAILAEKGIDPAAVIINKATIVLPFDENTSYDALECYPTILSPTCKVYGENSEKEEVVSYAGITDSSVSSENQGDINRSKFEYSPDISYHMQQILALEDYSEDEEAKKEYEQKDIWLLTLAVENAQEEQEGISEYYQNLQYSMYYNNLYNNYYGYGYGGYGYGYGGYYGGYGYNNYYDYYAMAAYYSAMQSSQTQSNRTTTLDRDRYYRAVLRGPLADQGDEVNAGDDQAGLESRRVPYLKVTYSVRKK